MHLFFLHLLQHLPVPYTAPSRARSRTPAPALACVYAYAYGCGCVGVRMYGCAGGYGWVLPKCNGVADYNYNQVPHVAYV